MRIIKPGRIIEYQTRHPAAAPGLGHWLALVKTAAWTRFTEVRQVYRTADEVVVSSGRKVAIFNIGAGYRLITAIHYNRQKVFVLRFLTHAQYDRNQWKDQL